MFHGRFPSGDKRVAGGIGISVCISSLHLSSQSWSGRFWVAFELALKLLCDSSLLWTPAFKHNDN